MNRYIAKIGLNMISGNKHYDYVIIGAGLFGSTFAYLASKSGKKCLVIDKRTHVGGNLYCSDIGGIPVHKYGAHIFHTNNKKIWDFVNQFIEFIPYFHQVKATKDGRIYSLPFNLNTLSELKNGEILGPEQVKDKFNKSAEGNNLEECAISLVGKEIYNTLIKGYTEKQWHKECKNLPSSLIKRLPVRLIYDNNYFNDKYQGIPECGYNPLINQLLIGCDVELDCDYFENREYYDSICDKLVYTGQIDKFFGYKFGKLGYRSLNFDTKILSDVSNYQGCSVMNYTGSDVDYTRIIEHKHFAPHNKKIQDMLHTVLTFEYPVDYDGKNEPYYPLSDTNNITLSEKYKEEAKEYKYKVIFGGRLGEYKYYDMDKVIESAMIAFDKTEKGEVY